MRIIKENALVLMNAAGETMSHKDINPKSLPELIQVFVVGTEQRKVWKQRVKLPAKPSELYLVMKMVFVSTGKRGKWQCIRILSRVVSKTW